MGGPCYSAAVRILKVTFETNVTGACQISHFS
jgi:hypothetical protein